MFPFIPTIGTYDALLRRRDNGLRTGDYPMLDYGDPTRVPVGSPTMPAKTYSEYDTDDIGYQEALKLYLMGQKKKPGGK